MSPFSTWLPINNSRCLQATQGSTTDPYFSTHWQGATSANLYRAGYHYAEPAQSSGSTQATFFVEHGGNWTNDGRTLPGMLDIEYGPSGNTCYGLSASSMVSWISDFVSTYHEATSRYPVIYTTASWWNQCTGNSEQFSKTCAISLASYGSSTVGTIPGGWSAQTIWQNSDSYQYGGDSDIFNGDEDRLKALVSGS